MEIKELEESEIEKVVEFYKSAVLCSDEAEEDTGNFEKEIKNAFGKDRILIAIKNSEIVGFLRSQIFEKKDGKKVDKVIMILVSPEKYGEGIGGELVEKERKWAKDTYVDVLDIEVR
jgi:hypothetical protein